MNDNRHKFIMNVLKSIGSNVEYLEQHHKKRRNYIIDVLKQMDLSNIKITETEELIKLYELLQNLKRIVIQKSLMRQLSKEEAQKLLKWHLEIIKNGVIAKEAI